MTRGTQANTNSVAARSANRKRVVPWKGRGRRMLQKTTSPALARRTPHARAAQRERCPSFGAPSKATACATAGSRVPRSRAGEAEHRQGQHREDACSTRSSLIFFRSASAAHTRSPHMSVMIRASSVRSGAEMCLTVSRHGRPQKGCWPSTVWKRRVTASVTFTGHVYAGARGRAARRRPRLFQCLARAIRAWRVAQGLPLSPSMEPCWSRRATVRRR